MTQAPQGNPNPLFPPPGPQSGLVRRIGHAAGMVAGCVRGLIRITFWLLAGVVVLSVAVTVGLVLFKALAWCVQLASDAFGF